MPLPALAGLPWLASIIITALVYIFEFAVKNLTKKVGIIVVLVAALALLINEFISRVTSYATSIISSIPQIDFVPYFMPSIFGLCISVVIGFELLATTYRLATRFAVRKASIFAA